jgi:hypothetical protein
MLYVYTEVALHKLMELVRTLLSELTAVAVGAVACLHCLR